MTAYSIEKIDNGVATVRYADNSWAELVLAAEMTEADLDDLAHQFAPKIGDAPSFATAGFTSTALAKPEPVEEYVDVRPAWLISRLAAYGPVESQIEFITENGLEAWQTKVAEIKAAYPKP